MMIFKSMKKLLLSFLIVGFSINGQAQKESPPSFYKLSVSPFKFVTGDFGVQYETRLAKHLALDVGIGVTYSFELVEDVWNRFSGSYNPIPGASGRAIIRYYPFHANTRKGFSMEGMVRFQRFNGEAPNDRFEFESSLQNMVMATDMLHISLNLSYQFISSGNWIFRPYFGIGNAEKSQYYTREITSGVIDGTSNSAAIVVEHKRQKAVTLYPSFKFGLDIGMLNYKK